MLVRWKVRKVVLVRAGKGNPLAPMGLEDVEGSTGVPSSSSSGLGVTAVVSGRDTAVGNMRVTISSEVL